MRRRIIAVAARIGRMNKMLTVSALLVSLNLAWPCLAQADEVLPPAEQSADWQERQLKGQLLRAEAAERKDAAKKLLAEKQAACASKFFVNDCRNKAQQEYVTASREATRLEVEGKTLEREVSREQLSERDQRSAAELQQHQAEMAGREQSVVISRDAEAARRAAILADKARKAEAGTRRKAEEANRLQARQAEHAARLAARVRAAAPPAASETPTAK